MQVPHVEDILQEWVNLPRLHHLLPYESYDPQSQLFYNQGATGFVLAAQPIVGASLDDQQGMAQFFCRPSNLPEGASVQFLMFASPCISPHLNYWQSARQGAVFQKLAQRRRDFLEAKAYQDPAGFLIRDYRVLISYTVPGHVKDIMARDQLQMVRQDLMAILAKLKVHTDILDAEGLIREVGTILNLHNSTWPYPAQWNEHDTLAKQIIDPDKNYLHQSNHLFLNDGQTLCRSYRPHHSPELWALGHMDRLIGDVLNVDHKISCPFLTHAGFYVLPNQGAAKAKAYSKRETLENALRNGMSKFTPNLRSQYEEASEICEKFQIGDRAILSSLTFTLFSPNEDIYRNEKDLFDIWQASGWSLQPTRYNQLPTLISCLPMTWTLGEQGDLLHKEAYGYGTELYKMGQVKKTVTSEAQNLLPLLAEWKGQTPPGIPLVGRRGQLFFWSPFGLALLPTAGTVLTDHDYNVCIAGHPGSGKSVFMNELLATVLGVGGKVFVLDFGKSFKNNCQMRGGQYIDFDIRFPISLNPFSRIPTGQTARDNEEREEMLSLITPVIKAMAGTDPMFDKLENSYIEQAVRWSWRTYQTRSSVDTVREFLENHQEREARNVGQLLYAFSSHGPFGHFFNKPANANFENTLVVIETENLRNYPALMAVVVQMLIIQINQIMAKGDRKTPFVIMIDEAWQLLAGKSTAQFISALSRTSRKYKGSLTLATQHLTDYFKPECPGATEAFNSAGWKCILHQKSDVISSLKNHPQLQDFVKDGYRETLLKSIHAKPPHYSEVAIFGPGVEGIVGRLRLDPFSRILYSTNASEYSMIERLLERGHKLEDAIELIIEYQEGRLALEEIEVRHAV
ncbi:type IV secretion system protein TraC [Candidatus Odyssella thessalonicensis]|uniref:type IV secretion system protein TraC n=1 Tax=Candidatus Odyssella thessalonicensis TaxID=84647 RepID=UPI000225B969|nr:type IV secretion system protein TraC [Candidatus Odyssella thessalonicensis]